MPKAKLVVILLSGMYYRLLLLFFATVFFVGLLREESKSRPFFLAFRLTDASSDAVKSSNEGRSQGLTGTTPMLFNS